MYIYVIILILSIKNILSPGLLNGQVTNYVLQTQFSMRLLRYKI